MRVPSLDWLFRDVEAEFECGARADDCVGRLCQRMSSGVVGQITTSEVLIRRYRPWQRNSMGPFFVGAFTPTGNAARLRGTLKVSAASKAFLAFFILFCIVGLVTNIGSLVVGAWSAATSVGAIVFFCGALYLTRWEIRIWRRDSQWLSDTIRDALGKVT